MEWAIYLKMKKRNTHEQNYKCTTFVFAPIFHWAELKGLRLFSEPKRAHVTPLFVSLHWLPVAARIKFKTLMLVYRTATGSAPPTSTHWWQSASPPEAWDLRVSDASWCHHREAQNHVPEHFYSPFLAGGMNFPRLSGMLSPWQFSSNTWKLISSIFT